MEYVEECVGVRVENLWVLIKLNGKGGGVFFFFLFFKMILEWGEE